MAIVEVIVMKKMACKTKSKMKGRKLHGKQKMSIEFVLANQELDLIFVHILCMNSMHVNTCVCTYTDKYIHIDATSFAPKKNLILPNICTLR